MVAISYFLAKMEWDDLNFDLDTIDIEDLTTMCGVVMSEFYTQNEYVYINEFLNEVVDSTFLNDIARKLGIK